VPDTTKHNIFTNNKLKEEKSLLEDRIFLTSVFSMLYQNALYLFAQERSGLTDPTTIYNALEVSALPCKEIN